MLIVFLCLLPLSSLSLPCNRPAEMRLIHHSLHAGARLRVLRQGLLHVKTTTPSEYISCFTTVSLCHLGQKPPSVWRYTNKIIEHCLRRVSPSYLSLTCAQWSRPYSAAREYTVIQSNEVHLTPVYGKQGLA